jgi:lambda family phage tail tape measure protein
MANNDTAVLYIKLSDLGTINASHKDLKAFKGTFDSLQKDMNRPAGKGKGGWKNAMMGGNEYDVARGSAGATGASGRDFANQARGLDGLVRLYATYAANVFAAGAAFRALSNAADTTNMIKGMDQLGAVTGQSLGTIAKRLVEVTDGAISMRESIEATTKGTAAGLSSKQMEQLGQVANKASKALGVAMPDAISRLTRGISKLEPELLDELGLFTKIEKATQDYARSIGKTAGSLSDFERRQAFATAVLKEGLDKFSAIDVSANPYDRLLASLQNLGQGALEIVNKVLSPLVNVLTQNPTALLAVIAAIGASILKSAIPALGQYRQNLKNAANDSRMVFTQIYSDQQEKLGALADSAGAAAAEAYKRQKPTLDKIAELEKSAKGFSKGRKDFAALAGKDPFAITPEEIKSLENRARYLKGRNDAEAQALTLHLGKLKAIRAGAATAFETTSQNVISGTEPGFTTPGSNDIINRRTLNKLAGESIRSTAAETQAIYGSRAAYAKLNEQIALAREGKLKVITRYDEEGKAVIETTGKMNRLQAGYTRVAGVIGIVGQKLGSLINAFGIYGIVAGVVVQAISLLDSALSNTGDQAEAFSKSIDGVTDASKNLVRTFDVLNKTPFASGTIQGILALSNAQLEVSNSVETAIDAAKKLDRAMQTSPYDKVKDNIATFFGGGLSKNLAKSLNTTVQDSLQVFAEMGKKDEAEAILKQALGVESLDITSVTKAFEKGDPVIKKYSDAQKKLSSIIGNSSSNLQNFKSSTEISNKAYQEFIQSTANNNPLFKLGESLNDVSSAMLKVTSGGINEINAAFDDLTKNPEKFRLFGQDFVNEFVGMRDQFKLTFEAYNTYKNSINQLDREDLKLKKQLEFYNNAPDRLTNPEVANKIKALQASLDVNRESRGMASRQQTGLSTSVFTQAADLFSRGADKAFEKSKELINVALGQAAAKAALTIDKARAGSLTGEQAAIEQGRLKQRELQIQLNAINTNIDLIKSQELLRASIDESTALTAFNTAKPGEEQQAAELYGAAVIFKKALEESKGRGFVNIPLQNDGSLKESTLKLKMGTVNRQIATQQAAATGVQGEMAGGRIETDRAKRAGQLSDLQKMEGAQDSIRQQELARLNILGGITNSLTEQGLKDVQRLENLSAESKYLLEIAAGKTALADAAADQNFIEFDKQRKLLNFVEQRQEKEKDNKGLQDQFKIIDLRFAKEKLGRDIDSQAQENALKMTAAQLGAEQELFNARSSLGMIYGEQAETQRKTLEYSTLNNTILQSEIALQKEKSTVLAEIENRILKLAAAGKDTSEIEKEKAAALSNFESQRSALAITNDGRKRALELTQSLTDRQLAYGEVFKNSFDEMGNALIEFTKTGKLNFKSLIDGMIEGLIRYELQQQSVALYAAARPALMNLIGSVFGFGVGPITANGFRAQDLAGGSVTTTGPSFAKGGAFDIGLKTFAKGGMFTNSVVNSPTLFKFAQGAGLMGEAGPEAIMPLKRDSNGNLGVRAGGGGGSVDVVVNNYGNQQATTKETTDSRGNRKIEVIIGDMVASEVARPGSSVQQSLAGSFNSRPALARR